MHALHLSKRAPMLAPLYSEGPVPDAVDRVAAVLDDYAETLLPWLDGPPQTNEAGRAWGFVAAMLWLADQGCPPSFALHELGASAGINLMLARYRFDLGGVATGRVDAAMAIAP